MKILNRLIKDISGYPGTALLTVCCLVILATGCRREEFMPPAEGKQIPYEDSVHLTIKEALAQSSAKLFYQAWQRSHMDTILAAVTDPKSGCTILALSDEALLAGGYTASRIQSMDPKDLDSLLMFYALRGRFSAQTLTGQADNLITFSLLKRPGLRGMPDPDTRNPYAKWIYYFKQHLRIMDGKTYVNGRVVGRGSSIPAKDGYIWLLDSMVPKPEKTLLQVLEADSRFTMLLELMRQRDALYDKIFEEGAGYPASGLSFTQYYAWDLKKNPYTGQPADVNLLFTTSFLPTNDAFKAAGFNTVEDLMAFNERRGLPQYVDWSMKGRFATDSLLNVHLNWGIMAKESVGDYPRSSSYPVCYSNMFLSSAMSRLIFSVSFKDPNGTDYTDETYYIPLEFSKDASGKTLVKVKGSEAPPATIIESDIPTLMGPLHAVDRLLIPKGYKLDQ